MVHRLVVPLLLSTAVALSDAQAQEPSAAVETPVTATVLGLSGVGQPGRFRSQTQVIFSPASQQPERRQYEVFDPAPQLERAFTWAADDLNADKPGRITGSGRLIWRAKDSPAYDDSAILAAYRGSMKAGRPEGIGLYAARDGLIYDGQWRDGVPHGQGRLLLPNGAEYEGEFRHGLAEGRGTFTEPTWERFEGTFARGQRHGTGKTTLASGLTYESDWRAGTETPNSYRIRVAQIGAAPPVGGTEDVKFGITLSRPTVFAGFIGANPILKYAATIGPQGISVAPDDKRMMSIWLGSGTIENNTHEGSARSGIFAMDPSYIPTAKFDLSFQNLSQAAVEVQKLSLAVSSSETENRPAIELETNMNTACEAGFSPILKFTNFGWGAAQDSQLVLGFGSPESPAKEKTYSLGNLTDEKSIDISQHLAAHKFDVKYFKEKGNHYKCNKADQKNCLSDITSNREFGDLGKFAKVEGGRLYFSLKGKLKYTWADSKGTLNQRQQPVSADVMIGMINAAPECGAIAPEAARTKPIELKLDQSDYVINLPYRRTIAAGRVATYTLPLTAGKSSRHELRVIAELSDGRRLQTPKINILYFTPRIPVQN